MKTNIWPNKKLRWGVNDPENKVNLDAEDVEKMKIPILRAQVACKHTYDSLCIVAGHCAPQTDGCTVRAWDAWHSHPKKLDRLHQPLWKNLAWYKNIPGVSKINPQCRQQHWYRVQEALQYGQTLFENIVINNTMIKDRTTASGLKLTISWVLCKSQYNVHAKDPYLSSKIHRERR